MHLGDKKAQRARRNYTQNKAPLSENVMKEGERVLFHAPDWKGYRRGWSYGHFDISADPLAPIVAEK